MAISQLLVISMFLALHTASSTRAGIRLDLVHVDSGGNFSKLELLQRAALRSKARMANHLLEFSAVTTDPIAKVRVPVHPSGGVGEYLLDLAIGTPAKPFSAILDTGSDLIWTQCKPCKKCFQQPSPLFDPLKSSSFSKLPCSSALCQALPISNCSSTTSRSSCQYYYSYGDGSSTQGVFASETLTFGSSKRVSIPHLGFGCGILNLGDFANASGLFGFGRGSLSLISQLGFGKFSYCFTSIGKSKPSPLLFGPLAKFNYSTANGHVVTTPLIPNPAQPSFYYLSLRGITVGVTRLRIPKRTFALKKDGTGGVIIDSGTAVTNLEEAAYKLVKRAFVSHVKLPVRKATIDDIDLCFSLPPNSSAASVNVPQLIYHFHGADLHLTRENYLVEDSGLMCLTIAGSTGMSIIGNLQQQNMQVLYDLENEKLSFKKAQCDSV